MRRTLIGLSWQTAGRPEEILVISMGSRSEVNAELADLCADAGARLIVFGDPSAAWNKPLALNVGIRATRADLPYVMVLDADMILSPNCLDVVLHELNSPPRKIVLCRSSDLPEGLNLPVDEDRLGRDYPALKAMTSLRGRFGTGALQATSRDFFFAVRGYDEDFLWWGAMDNDMVNRAKERGLKLIWVEDKTSLLHQWHPRKFTILEDGAARLDAEKYWVRNRSIMERRRGQTVRNLSSWGQVVQGRDPEASDSPR